MSSGVAEQEDELVRELRQFQEISAAIYRAVAGQMGMPITDMQVIDALQTHGPATAGQLAELAGLTTGAITGMLNRLEEAGIVRRERDPGDGRRVIVRLVASQDATRAVGPLLDAMSQAWRAMTADYTNEQRAFLLDFLQRSNVLFRQEMVQLRDAPEGAGGDYSAPLGDVANGQLVVVGSARLTLGVDHETARFYAASFEGPTPDVKATEGTVTIRYPRNLWGLGAKQRGAEILLSAAIPWQIVIQSGTAVIAAELGGLDLVGLEVKGGMNVVRLALPTPTRVTPVRLNGGASTITVRRPAGVAARVHLKGWVSLFVFDDQTLSDLGNDVRLQSAGYSGTGPYYDIEISSSASMVTITTEHAGN